MHKGKTYRLGIGIFVLMFACLTGGAKAADQTGNAGAGAAAAAAAEPSPAAQETTLDELRELIENQRRQIEKMQSVLEKQQRELDRLSGRTAAPAASAAEGVERMDDVELVQGELEAVADGTAQAPRRIGKLETDTAASRKETDAKGKQLGIFTFGGDVRARLETFGQEGAELRQRGRFRLRFNVTGKISDEFNAGFSLATGSLDDPVSTNQTMTGFFSRKNIGIDKAFVTYTPQYAKFLRLDAGKFSFPWVRTGLTFDGDVNPEGFAQTLNFDIDSPVLTNFKIVGFQLPFNEVSGGLDSFIYGGQVQAQFRMGSRANLGLYVAGLDIQRPDPIAVAIAGGSLKPSLSNSNTYRYNANNAVVGYATGFAYLDTILKLDLDTHPRFPTSILFNFVNNMRGSRERSGYWTELTVGKNREKNDVQLGYSFIRIEKDAVIGAWNESDLRSATNVRNHKFSASYMLHSKVNGQFTAWIGKLANPLDNTDLVPSGVRGACTGTDVSGCEDPYLKRLQFDVVYKF